MYLVKKSLSQILQLLEDKAITPKSKLEHLNKILELSKQVDDVSKFVPVTSFLRWLVPLSPSLHTHLPDSCLSFNFSSQIVKEQTSLCCRHGIPFFFYIIYLTSSLSLSFDPLSPSFLHLSKWCTSKRAPSAPLSFFSPPPLHHFLFFCPLFVYLHIVFISVYL